MGSGGQGGGDPYGSNYGMPHNPYGGAPGYGHPGMMGGPHMHGGSGYGGMGGGMGGGSSGRGGVVPFRAGDWKCGNEGCGYHNFAKNVSCLRCGASRSNAAVVAEGGMTTFPGGPSYGGPPGPPMGNMGNNSYGGMPPGGNSGYGQNDMSGGFSGNSFGPQSTYALPSGIGAPSPYMQSGYSQMSNNGNMPPQGGFDSRAEQAFNQGNQSATGGANNYSNGGYNNSNSNNNQSYGNDGSSGPSLDFLSGEMGNLNFGNRPDARNGQNNTKSPQ